MSYSTKEITEKLNMSKHTLRYYEKEGLLTEIARDKNGNREYSDLNLEQLVMVRCMRATGMSIKYIKNYVNMCFDGYSSVPSRKEILLLQQKILKAQKEEINKNLEIIDLKLQYYENLEINGPEKYDDSIYKIHSDLSAKMMKILDKETNTQSE
ncbi:MerR family transcriptional regulator [Clostridium beijerinckii]|uniref:DNA-binding transcriptional MerR regulator n=1 Tax=Clostridium beijerinckii TaxID=1520 RepID=A0AAX0B9S7_CLOBE|nr:MerR family transcriptional regulator [Clostridium beijerinckii]NRT91921.1 DNA-binding transcriptional MerR regulator [Clostridium beijerinckii]NYC71447.1 DNA-binding transcriptional MerR regulator [Clostridium beijerinckii]